MMHSWSGRLLLAASLLGLGWSAGRAQAPVPDFELKIDIPVGFARVECVRGCVMVGSRDAGIRNVRRKLSARNACTAARTSSLGGAQMLLCAPPIAASLREQERLDWQGAGDRFALLGGPFQCFLSSSRTDPEYDVVSVMNKVIGGGPTGRLFMVLREEKGYTYGAYSNVSAPSWRGAWQASTQVRTPVTGDALRALLAEVTKLREQPVSDKEFADHKRSMVGSFASLESRSR